MLRPVDREAAGVESLELRPLCMPFDMGAPRARRVISPLLREKAAGADSTGG